MELVEIVNNFSQTRIDHLQKVISVVLADKIRSAKTTRTEQAGQQTPPQPSERSPDTKQTSHYNSNNSPAEIEEQKKAAGKQALSQITNSIKKIEGVMDNIKSRGEWMMSDIQELENAAKQILNAAQTYKSNR